MSAGRRLCGVPRLRLQEQFETEIAGARAESAAAVKEVADVRKQLAAAKETYRDVTVSEAHYEVCTRADGCSVWAE